MTVHRYLFLIVKIGFLKLLEEFVLMGKQEVNKL